MSGKTFLFTYGLVGWTGFEPANKPFCYNLILINKIADYVYY